LYSCQYAPPHPFNLNLPRALATVRRETYIDYAWPAGFGALYRRNGLVLALTLASSLALFFVLALALTGTLATSPAGANFYGVFSHNLLIGLFGFVFVFALVALGIGAHRFWRDEAPGTVSSSALAEAARDVFVLKYLDGGHGEGCNNADDAFSLARRRCHHLTFYGLLLCFVATCVATLYHYGLGLKAPYALVSAPVVLGTVGGVSLLIGAMGLLWLNLTRDSRQGDVAQRPMDRGFIVLLMLASASGLALLAWRDSAAMTVLLAVHLGIVLALFLTLPYGKFAHGIYRSAALLKWTIEKRQPSKLIVGND